jgi:hypothetical protein
VIGHLLIVLQLDHILLIASVPIHVMDKAVDTTLQYRPPNSRCLWPGLELMLMEIPLPATVFLY